MPLQKHSQVSSKNQQSQTTTFNKYLLPQQSQVINIDQSPSLQVQPIRVKNKKEGKNQHKLQEKQKTIKSKSRKKKQQIKEQEDMLEKKTQKTQRKKSEKKKKSQRSLKEPQNLEKDINFGKDIALKEQDSAFNLIKNQYKQQDQSKSSKRKQNKSEDFFLGIDVLDKKKSKGKKQKQKQKQIKIKNKYFSDLNVQKSEEEKPDQQSFMQEKLQLQITSKTSSTYQTYQRFDKRIDFIKGRMEFKNKDNDLKYKKQLKQKLSQIDDVQEVQVSIEVPNVFTNKSVSGALYMKNIRQSQQKQENDYLQRKNSKIQQDTQKSNSRLQLGKNKNKKINRTDFFSQLNKQIKTKKQTNISSQQIKQCFKTSALDQKDDIQNQQYQGKGQKSQKRRDTSIKGVYNQDSFSIISNKTNRSQSSRDNSLSKSNCSKEKQVKNSSIIKDLKQTKNISIKQQIQSDISSSIQINNIKSVPYSTLEPKNILQINKSSLQLHNKKQQRIKEKKDIALEISKKLSKIAEKIKDKKQIEKITQQKIKIKKQEEIQKNKSKINKKTSQLEVQSYFQQEAEVSGDQQSQQFQDQQQQIQGVNLTGDLIDLIDNSNYLLQKNEHLVKQKFLQDQILQDQKLINRIKSGMFRKVKAQPTQSQKRLKKRMYEAAKRHHKEDFEQTQIEDDIMCSLGRQVQVLYSQNQSQSKNKQKQLQKLQWQLIDQDIKKQKANNEQDLKSLSTKKNIQDPWKFLNYVMPTNKQFSKNLQKKQIKIENQKKKNGQKTQRSTFGERKSLQKKVIRQKSGNLNKLQKKKEIQLQFRNKEVSLLQTDFTSEIDI